MELRVKRLEEHAKLPERAHSDDAGADLFAFGDYDLLPGETKKVRTGIAVALPKGYVGLIWDKSSVGAAGVKTLGGVVDAGYRGEILVVMHNLTDKTVTFRNGQKIAQMLVQQVAFPSVVEVSTLEETTRNIGSFGSTGA